MPTLERRCVGSIGRCFWRFSVGCLCVYLCLCSLEPSERKRNKTKERAVGSGDREEKAKGVQPTSKRRTKAWCGVWSIFFVCFSPHHIFPGKRASPTSCDNSGWRCQGVFDGSTVRWEFHHDDHTRKKTNKKKTNSEQKHTAKLSLCDFVVLGLF